MLLGDFSTYTELTARVDKAVRHWQNDFYIQDNWRATPRLTLDYGVRFQHSGSDYEVNNNHTGSSRTSGTRARRRGCTGWSAPPGVAGRPGVRNGEPAVDRSCQSGRVLLVGLQRQHRAGLGQSDQRRVDDGIPGAKTGTYFKFPYLVAAPRFGMAWNVTGDGKTAIRASAGIFYNFPRSTGTGGYSFAGGCPVSCSNSDPVGDV